MGIVNCDQFYEYTFWGPATSNPTDEPNPRLEAKVRLLLDSVCEDPGDVRGNTATCAHVNGIAAGESLNFGCKLANPASTGIHNKMVLVQAGGKGYVHTGSINGSEDSSKANREFAVQAQSDAVYDYLARVFKYDWGEYRAFLPLVLRGLPPIPNQPTLDPINNGDGDGNYTVSWMEQPVPLSDSYTLEEATNADFTSGLRVVCTTTQQSCDMTDKLAAVYYYRVQGQNAWASGPYSNVEAAEVLVPGTPYLDPIDNADGDGNYTVIWTAAERAATYTLEEDIAPDFPAPTSVYVGAGLSWPAENKSPMTWYYRVRASGSTGMGQWSNVQSVTVPEPATADVYIHSLSYDQSDEYVEIRNRGAAAQDMTNRRIHSVVGDQMYTFPSGFALETGASVYVHSGADGYSSPPTHLLWDHTYIWNNSGDKAVLYNAASQPVDSYCYVADCP